MKKLGAAVLLAFIVAGAGTAAPASAASVTPSSSDKSVSIFSMWPRGE